MCIRNYLYRQLEKFMKSKLFNVCAITLAILSPISFAAGQADHEQHHPDTTAANSAPNKAPRPVNAPKANSDQMRKMDAQIKTMREMHDKMMAAKTPEERSALMADHMKSMQDGMAMMDNMMGGKSADKATLPPQMMQKQMEMMQMEMQMMMDRMGTQGSGK
jgi:hypothetical protein